MSRPRSPDFFPGSTPQPRLSPVPQAGPGRAATTPGELYRSCFAQECEAVVVQLSSAAAGLRCALTIQEETLTLLEPACSFLDSPDGTSSPRPSPGSASDGFSPPEPFVTAPSIEQQSTTGTSPGPLAAASPVSGLAGGAAGPEWKDDSPPPSGANVTYECDGSAGSANATYVCPASPSEKETDAASAQSALGVCERELPFVTSTPLIAPPASKDASPVALHREGPPREADFGADSAQNQESGFRVTFVASPGSLSPPASQGAEQRPNVPGKAPLAKRNLSLGAPRALRPRGAPGVGALPKGTGTTKKILQPAGGNRWQNLVAPPTRSGSVMQSQPVVQKLLPDEKSDLTKLPCNKKPPISIQPPSKLGGRSGVQESLTCLGLKLDGASTDNASGTRLPVPAGNRVTAKTATQKRPWEKPSDKVTVSPLKQPFPKRSRLCKSQKEKSTCSDLQAFGQIPSAVLKKKFTAPCSQCQLLAEENQQLKSMLETCRKTIAFLEGKQTVLENENCPPQTAAR